MRKSKLDLTEILENIPADKQVAAKGLVKEIEFMKELLEDLKQKIKEFGTLEEFSNGKQHFMRESPAVKSYNTTVQRYCRAYQQLVGMLPKEKQKDLPGADLAKFIEEG